MKDSANRRFRWARLVAAVCIHAVMAGCILVPIPASGNKVLAGQPVTDEQLAFLSVGKTTKAEVVRNFGTPDIIWEDADIHVYQWDMLQGSLFWALVGAGGQGAMGLKDIPKHHLLLIAYDRRGRVRQYEKVVRPITITYAEFLRQWARNHPQ